MSKFGNTIGILVPQPGAPGPVSTLSANPPEPLQTKTGPIEKIEMVTDVASDAISLVAPDSAAEGAADAVSLALSLAAMVPGKPGPIPPAHTGSLKLSGGGIGMGFDGGFVDRGRGSGSGRASKKPKGRANEKKECKTCKNGSSKGKPVNPVLGIKILPQETDFTLDSLLPLVWRRSYYSDQYGNSWLGQGWSLPFSMRLERTADGFLYIDEQGREIQLPDADGFDDGGKGEEDDGVFAVGADEEDADPYGLAGCWFDPSEQIFFGRVSDGLYQIAAPDGSAKLYFSAVAGHSLYPLVAILDRNGNHTRIVYGNNGLPQEVIDAAGRRVTLNFVSIRLDEAADDFDPAAEDGVFRGEDGNLYVNRLGAASLAGREMVRYHYDGRGDLTAVYGRGGKKLRGFAYRNHIMIEHSQPEGLVSRYRYDTYDTGGKVLCNTTNTGEEWTFDYREDHTLVTDVLGRCETFGFDGNYELSYYIDAEGNRSDTERDDDGWITGQTDPLGRETRYGYNRYGQLESTDYPDGSCDEMEYHSELNLPVAYVERMGPPTLCRYDGRGNPIEITDPAGGITRISYGRNGEPESITDPLGKTVRYRYNGAGLPSSYTDCSGGITRFSYTDFGDLESVTDALGQTVRYHYDEAGNHIRTDYPDGGSEHYEYDHLNRLTGYTDPLGNRTVYELAADGLPLKRTDALGHSFGYRYDAARRLAVLTNENGESYRLEYDAADNLIRESGWDGRITEYGYDKAGQLNEQREYGDNPARPLQIHRFERDILGRLTDKISRRTDRNRHTEAYSRSRYDYDPVSGRLSKARNGSGSVELEYDALGRITGETVVHNGREIKVGYRYDGNGNRIRTELPDGSVVDHLYYGSGHLHRISCNGETVSDIERDALHRETSRTQGHIGSVYEYDPMGRLKRQQTHALGEGGKQDVQVGAVSRRYAYDRAGNLIRSEDRRGGTLEYVYDKLGRIREAKHSGGSVERFAFDPAGNILSANHPAATSAGRLKSQPQKTPSNPNLYAGNRLKEHDGTEYTYDGLGNLIYRQLPDGENQYFQYDSENQLVRAEIKKAAGNTEIWEYAYDPFGRRLSKERKDKLAWTSTEPKRIHFVWDGSRLAQEYTYKGTYTYIYTDQDSYEPLAQIFHNNKDGKQYLAYIHTDQIGIPREMTDQFGNLLWYGEYTAWGRLKKDGRVYQNAHQPFRLQNQYYDRETGLHYNLMRYYEAETGRFINQDPIGLLGGENLYSFAPNAQAWVDPLGLAHSMFGELIRDGKTIFSNSYTSGNGVGTGRLNQQQALQTHTERKFLADIKDMVRPGDTIKMKGELNPCRPGCQPAIRDFVGEKGVNAEYHATNTGKTYKWKRMPDGKVLQTEKAGSKIKAFIYNLITRRRKPSKC